MVADLPIIRQDKELGEHYVVFRKDTIEHIVDKFMRSNNNDSINLMHDPSRTAKDVFIIRMKPWMCRYLWRVLTWN